MNEDCYGAKVSDLTVTIGEDDFANFSVGSEVTVNYDGKDHIRKVRDFPEDIGIVVKGYPIYYSDFDFISTDEFDDWYGKDKFTESNVDLDSPKVTNVSFYSFERNFVDKIKELLSHYKYGVYDIDRHNDLCDLLTDALKVWKRDSKDYRSKLEIIKDDLNISKNLIQKYYRKDTAYITFINGMIKEIENHQSNSKEDLKESAIDYSSMFDKSKDIFHKGDFDKYKISDEELKKYDG